MTHSMTPTIITLTHARAAGLSWYFTGVPCKRGHLVKRNTVSRACKACAAGEQRARMRAKRSKNRRACVICGALFRPTTNSKTCCYAHLRQWRNAKNYQWRKNNPEIAANTWRVANAKWRTANPDKVRMHDKRRRERHSKTIYERQKIWRAANPLKVAQHSHRRRMRKKGVGIQHTLSDAVTILKAQKYKCAICRSDLRKVKSHRDHITPLSKGGSDDRRNIQWLCQTCNTRKSNKDPLVFSRENGLLL